MPTTIESLELEVQSSATSATNGIDALSASLSKLKNAVKGGVGLTSVTNQLKGLSTALQGIDSSAAGRLDTLSSGLSKLSTLKDIKISPAIGNQLKNIGSAVTSLNEVDFTNITRLSSALSSLSSLGRSNLSSFITQLGKLPQLAETLATMNMEEFINQIRRLSEALAPLASRLNTITAGFASLPAYINRVLSATNKMTNSNYRAAKSYVNLWAKLRMARNAVRGIATVMASWITESNNYIENLNLFNVSMGEYASEAKAYAEQVGEVMGIDPGEWMRNQGIFMTLATGFGVASDKAYTMSKNLTQLGYDISSFFNISYAESMQKLQSALSGELEPLRRLGYDLSQARLQQEALNLGIDKSVSSMTQAEKAQLRYYAIMTQVTTVQGDMARTLEAPANQLRVLNAQITQCSRALGNIFIPTLNLVTPYLIAFFKVLRSVIDLIGKFVGFELAEVDYSGISSSTDALGDLTDAEDSATEAAKALKNAMLGIDELNVVNSTDSSSDSGILSGSDLGFELPEYNFLDNAVNERVDEIVKKFQEWTGVTEDLTSWSEFFQTNLGEILVLAGKIGIAFGAWKISGALVKVLGFLKSLSAGGVPAAISGVLLYVTGITSSLEEGISKASALMTELGAVLVGGGAGAIGAMLGAWAGPVGIAVGALVGTVVGALTNLGIYLYQNWDEIAVWGKGVGESVKQWFSDRVDDVKNFPKDIVSALKNLPNKLDEAFASANEWLDSLPEKIQEKFQSFGQDISEGFSDLWSSVTNFDWESLGEKMGNGIGEAFEFVLFKLPAIAVSIQEWFKKLWKEDIPRLFTEYIPDLWFTVQEGLLGVFSRLDEIGESIKEGFVGIVLRCGEGIAEGFRTISNAWQEWKEGFIQGFKDAFGISSPSKVFQELGGYIVEGLIVGIQDAFSLCGETISKWAGNVVEWFTKGSDGKGITEHFKDAAANIVTAFGDKMGTAYTSARTSVVKWASNVKSWFRGEASESKFKEFAKNTIDGFSSKIGTYYTAAKATMTAFGESVKNWFTENVSFSNFSRIASDVVDGFKNGISDTFTSCKNTVTSWGSSVITWVEDTFAVESPSKVFYGIGAYSIEGYNNAIYKEGKTTKGIVSEWSDSFVDTVPQLALSVDTSAIQSFDPSKVYGRSLSAEVQGSYQTTSDGFTEGMEEFYREYIEPTISRMAEDVRRQADKEEQTIVQIGNRTVTDTVTTQQKANGYRFAT